MGGRTGCELKKTDPGERPSPQTDMLADCFILLPRSLHVSSDKICDAVSDAIVSTSSLSHGWMRPSSTSVLPAF